ncbi:MAG TPA: LytTR family DNA-binding domain-containing protein [Pyrinomonadaceae bacterium]|jgi:two-component system LytT family response regulator
MINNLIKVLVVDDEPLARILIIELLKDFPEFQVAGECSNGTEALEAVRENLPDLVFLDVQMPEMDGLTLLEKIQKEHLPAIIFVTAYDQFAIRAFDFHAVDYLLKPFSKERFEKALLRVKERLSNHSTIDLARRQISSLLENYQNKSAPLKRLFIKDKGKIILLEPETIDWIEADDKYVHLHTAGKSYLLRQTLNVLEAELDPQAFARIHRSTIVNLARVRELNPLFNGEYVLILANGTKLTLSRNYKNRFFEQFGKNPRI